MFLVFFEELEFEWVWDFVWGDLWFGLWLEVVDDEVVDFFFEVCVVVWVV